MLRAPMRPVLVLLGALALSAAPAQSPAQSPAPSPRPTAPPLDAPARRRIVDSVSAVLVARYVDPAVAARLSARLHERLASGAYDALDEPARFAAALVADLQRVVADKHLRLSYEPEREYGLSGAGGGPTVVGGAGASRSAAGSAVPWRRIDGRDSATIARTNFAFERVERLPGNVGYLKLGQFVPLDYSRQTAVAAMAFLDGSDAVILDLRDNVGGSPDLVDLLASYFLPPEPTVLLRTYSRAADQTFERRSLREVPGRRMEQAALYVLVNGNSASAAEMLPYVLQRLGRATVVGERTAGAGNGGAKLSVGAGLALFVPQMQIVSGPGYERTGVQPDVAVPSDSALAVAQRLATERLAAQPAPPEVARERAWALELLAARSRPAPDARALARYAGRYGTETVRTVRVEDGRLVTVGVLGYAARLVPVGADTFRAPDVRFRFETDAAGRATALLVETIDGRTTRLPRVESAGVAGRS